VYIDSGKVVEEGSHDTLISMPIYDPETGQGSRYKKLWIEQQRALRTGKKQQQVSGVSSPPAIAPSPIDKQNSTNSA
jgi:hypothetical protein